MGLKMGSQGFGLLPNAIPHDEEKASPETEVTRHGVDKFGFFELLVPADVIIKSLLGPGIITELGTPDRLLKVGIAPRLDAFDIIHHLRNDLATSLRVSPELTFCKEKIAGGRNKEVVDVTSRRGELGADRNDRFEGRLDLFDRQELGVRVN
jgi:hypothetical protein